jgi:hypothetical protein
MTASTVRRTLIRSTPELWAEVSDAAALARHLEEFGDIRITRLDEEAAVAWESERAKGMVTLEASGLGTRVTLTATPIAPPAPAAPRAEAAAQLAAPPTQPARPGGALHSAEPSGPATPVRPVLFGRRRSDRPRLLERLRPRPRITEPPERDDPQVPAPAPPAAPVPFPVRPAPPVGPGPEPAAAAPALNGSPTPPAFDSERATAVLTNVLDQLGTARHRPFGAT